jgi:8-oxo-dGTP pyrophosphatase MutT (NUDIX family)
MFLQKRSAVFPCRRAFLHLHYTAAGGIMGKRKGCGSMVEVVAALIWDGDRFLICQRPAHKSNALLWEFVGGKVEPGETHEDALVRECREEMDIAVAVGLGMAVVAVPVCVMMPVRMVAMLMAMVFVVMFSAHRAFTTLAAAQAAP